MSDLQELRPPIRAPSEEPLASDGSRLTVIRDAQGQITEASGTGRDGVVRRFTVTSKNATNPDGFHFFSAQLDFFEQGKEYLRVGTILSPDAGKASWEAYSPTSQFGFAVGISPAAGQAIVITTTGSRVTVDLSRVSLLSAHTPRPLSVPASPARGPLTPPQGIQEALRKAGYFQPLFEQENEQNTADLEAALQAVNLSASMHADVLVSRLSSQGTSPGNKSGLKAVVLAVFKAIADVVAAMDAAAGIGTSIVIGSAAGALAGPSPTGTNDTPPNDVVVPPLSPDDVQQPPADGGTGPNSTGFWINSAKETCSWCGNSTVSHVRSVMS